MQNLRRPGFTLIELLVVITIIILLTALLIPAIATARRNAKAVITVNRMENALLALNAYGQSTADKTSGYRLHRHILGSYLHAQPGLSKPGVLDFVSSEKFSVSYVDTDKNVWFQNGVPGSTIASLATNTALRSDPFLYTDSNHVAVMNTYKYLFAWPWGSPAIDTASGAGAKPIAPLVRSMRDLNLDLTWELLDASDLFTANTAALRQAQYWSDRGTNARWNDAWGNPLVPAWGFYQPPKNTLVTVRKGRFTGVMLNQNSADIVPIDFYFQQAEQAYQHTRAVYVVLAAAGQKVRTTQSGTNGAAFRTFVGGIWNQLTDPTAGSFPMSGKDWTEASFAQPPWKGICQLRYKDEYSFMSTPMVIR